MLYEIKSWLNGSVLFSLECGSLKLCVEAAVGLEADLSYADLSSADLSSANLRSADLSSANLRSANLSSANLSSANLRSADLRSANLRSANLRSADLSYANLRSADLSYADLRSADLSSANLRSANLRSANLRSADLSYADLSYADLRSANLPAGAIATKPPIQLINVLPWPITIIGSHVMIGCQLRPAAEWESMTDEELAKATSGGCCVAVELRRKWLAAISAFRDREGERLWAERQKVEA